MPIYVDIDGTLTSKQCGRSFFRGAEGITLREDVIAQVKAFYDAGHEIMLWTGSTSYAQRVAAYLLLNYGIKVIGAARKPDLLIDNEGPKLLRRMKERMRTPEEFVAMDAKSFGKASS